MAIDLIDIRGAVDKYLEGYVKLAINKPEFEGGYLSPEEEFTFSIEALNADMTAGGIALENVRYCIWVRNPEVAELIVPPKLIAREDADPNSAQLGQGKLVRRMCLFPPGRESYLDPGEKVMIPGLKGKAGSGKTVAPLETDICFRIHADIDMDYLFPKDQAGAIVGTKVLVYA